MNTRARHPLLKILHHWIWPDLCAVLGTVIAAGFVHGCGASLKDTTKTVIDITTASCIVLRAKVDNDTLDEICATEEELAPFVKTLVQARKASGKPLMPVKDTKSAP